MYRPRNMKRSQDLELRLGLSPKGGNTIGATFRGGYPELITIEDDDDDDDDEDDEDDELQIFSHRPSSETIRFFARFGSWTPVISDEDLELRLGPRDLSGCGSEEEPLPLMCSKKELGQASSSQVGLEVHQLKLRCSICMDTMKEETSTVCGHIFCKPCITNAIKIQNKCPTCREKLSQSSIHRIYLPGTT